MNKLFFCISFFLFVHIHSMFSQAMMAPYWFYDNSYLTDKYIVNPAFAGEQQHAKLFVSTNRMALILRESPAVHLAGMHGRLALGRKNNTQYKYDLSKERNAAGGLVFADINGPFQNIGVKLDYAHIVPLKSENTNLSFGIGGMFFSKRLILNRYINESADDPLIAASNGNKTMIPDFNAGVLFSHNGFYAGFSVSQLLENSYRFSETNYSPAQVYRNYYLLAGKRFVYEIMEIEPSIAAGYNLAPESYSNNGRFVDLNVEFFLRPVVFTLSYRVDGFIGNSLLFRTSDLELGVRWELFSTNATDASYIGFGVTASYNFTM